MTNINFDLEVAEWLVKALEGGDVFRLPRGWQQHPDADGGAIFQREYDVDDDDEPCAVGFNGQQAAVFSDWDAAVVFCEAEISKKAPGQAHRTGLTAIELIELAADAF